MDPAKGKWSRIWVGILGSALTLLLASFAAAQVPLQSVSADADPTGSGDRIAHLERAVLDLQREIELLRSSACCPQPAAFHGGEGMICDGCDGACPSPAACPSHYVTYDDGWAIRPRNPVASPFELKFNIHNQFRFTEYSNSNDTFVDAAGNVNPIAPRSDFDINRGRFVFSGYAFDPNILFYTNIDYSTVAARPVQLLLSSISYRFSENLIVSMGLGKVPGTWEWQETSRITLGVERTIASTFFRPSITAGIWAVGQIGETLHYQAMVGDGFNTFTLQAAQLDPNLAYSTLLWWDPCGDFGTGFSDLEYHDSLSVRLGHGFTFASNDADPVGEPGPEQTPIRLSDGTRLVETGALAPGVTVSAFDISLYAVHLGLKRRGASLSTEYFFRWLTSIDGSGPLPVDSLFDHGFFAQGAFFVLPQRLEGYVRGSQVSGDFGTGSEYAVGFNWYCGGRRGSRFTFDFTRVDDSPTQQDRTGYVAGGSGALYRAQWWHYF